MNRRTKVLPALAAVLVMAAVIFFFSSQGKQASSEVSGKLVDILASVFSRALEGLSKAERKALLSRWDHIVRKCAHFTEYALLGALLLNYLRLRGRTSLRTALLIAWLGATLYAGTDELHQVFVDERAGMVTDVLIDSAGALAGTLAALGVIALRRRKRSSKGEANTQS